MADIWRIDPDTLTLVGGPPQPPSGYTAGQFDAQLWPPCPVCGTTIDVDRIDVTSKLSGDAGTYIVGRWRCPRGCDPRSSRTGPAEFRDPHE